MSNGKLYTLGNLTIDDIILYDSATTYFGSPGGNAVFAAIGALIAGRQPYILARVGVDYSAEMLAEIGRSGIVLDHLIRVPHHDVHSWALYEQGGGRQFVRHFSSGTIEEMTITGSDIPVGCLDGAGYHIASIPTRTQYGLLQRLRRNDAQAAFITVDPALREFDVPDARSTLREMLPLASCFLPSRDQAEGLSGQPDIKEAAQLFAAWGAQQVVIKLGREGALVHTPADGRFVHIPAFPVPDAVDPTGAGDTFCGGFLAGYLAGGDAIEAACWGAVAASFVVEHVGTLGVLRADRSAAAERLVWVRAHTGDA